MTSWTRWTTTTALASALALVPTAAHADTSRASASPLSVTTAAGATVAASTTSATSDGTAQDGTTPAVGALGGQSVVTAGVVASDVLARVDGTSAACAGLVGTGGSVRVGSSGACTTNPGGGGVSVTLALGVTLTADAITASCTASSTGGSTTRTTIVNGKVNGTSISATGTSGSLLGLVNLTTGAPSTSSAGAGPVSATALRLSLLSGTAAVRIGSVTCGENAVVVPTPALPLEGWPVALVGAAVAVVAGRALLRRSTGAAAGPLS